MPLFHRQLSTSAKLDLILEKLEKLMAQDDDLTAAVVALTGKVDGLEKAIADEIARINATPAASDPVVASAIANINGLLAGLQSSTDAVNAVASAAAPSTAAAKT